MKFLFTGICISLLAVKVFADGANELTIIPQPQKVKILSGEFELTRGTRIEYGSNTNGDVQAEAQRFAAELKKSTGFNLSVTKISSASSKNSVTFVLTTNLAKQLGEEGYQLFASEDGVYIRAATTAGLFYGAQTLLQLFPPEVFSSNVVTNVNWQMPCVQIEDWPRFKWRGLMLDVSRHFFTKSEVEQLLDAMASHKINIFHWHLTDDQGWRIEIKKYPKLTSVGAWRESAGFGLASNSTTAYDASGRYGGFYTQDDIREVVAYASARHITIVPEIEMPGHSSAALAAYPQFGAGNGPFTIPQKGGVFDGIYSPAKDETFQFLDDVLTEVFQLFPGKYIHIGGDEVPSEPWTNDVACQRLMKREGLKTTDELESWFIRRIEKFVNANGKTLIGWSEIANGGLAKNAIVMDWIGGGTEAARAGHDVVMTPISDCYFNCYQSQDHSTEPRAIGGYLPLMQVYSFEPIPTNLPPEFQNHILGTQANLWTEYIPNLQQVEYMTFPRLCALAEVTWSAKDARSFDDFSRRLKIDEQRLDKLGMNYRRNMPETRAKSD